MAARQLCRHRLDQGVLLESVDDRRPSFGHQGEELVLSELRIVCQQQVFEQLIIVLVELVEVDLLPITKRHPDEYRDGRVPHLVVVGAASRDLDSDDPRGWRLGGGVTYSSRAAAALGLRVAALMGVDEAAAGARELDDLRAGGVDLQLVRLQDGPVFENRETPAGRVQIAHSGSDRLPVAALPTRWASACAFLLNPVAGELDDVWASAPSANAIVGLGYQGMVRVIVPGEPVGLRALTRTALVARADLAGMSDEDLAPDPVGLDELMPRDGQQLVITRGERGGIHLARSAGRIRARRFPAIPTRRELDRTGAGDTFLAAWMAATIALGRETRGQETRDGEPDRRAAMTSRALRLAALASSLLVAGIPLDLGAVAERARELTQRDAAPR